MRKTHMKLGMLLAMTCLFLAAGATILGSGSIAFAQNAQASKKFKHWSMQAPHITVKMLAATAHQSSRAVISGVGFDNCDCGPATTSYNNCDTSCSTTNTTNTDVNTNTTTTTTTTTTRSSHSTTPSTVPSNTCPSDCGSSAPSYSAPASNTCSSNCGSSAPSYSAPAPSYNGCDCNTVNLQSSAPISAPGFNLSEIPVNTFGEFQITVNVPSMVRHHRHHTIPSFWAVNSYNDQPSNYAPMCTCD